MIPMKLPASHPDAGHVQRWARDKEQLLDTHATKISRLEGILKTILTNNPDLGKAK